MQRLLPTSQQVQTQPRDTLEARPAFDWERWTLVVCLLALTALSWVYLLVMADGMKAMTGDGGSGRYMWLMPMGRWDALDFALGFLMWIVMMIGMMIPSATPAILLYAKIHQRSATRARIVSLTLVFVLGYLLIWAAFSLAATALQWALTELRLYSDLMQSHSSVLSGTIFVLAGLYQFTPWKRACLAHCSSPLSFLTRHWRNGAAGALRMGLAHGSYCVGCCWLAMLVLFAVGVMNLLGIALLSIFVLVEKLAAARWNVAPVAGIALIALGVLTLATV